MLSIKYPLAVQPGDPNAAGNGRKSMVRAVEDIIGALTITLDAAQLDRLDAASGIDLGFPHDFLQYPFIREGLTAGTVPRSRS